MFSQTIITIPNYHYHSSTTNLQIMDVYSLVCHNLSLPITKYITIDPLLKLSHPNTTLNPYSSSLNSHVSLLIVVNTSVIEFSTY